MFTNQHPYRFRLKPLLPRAYLVVVFLFFIVFSRVVVRPALDSLQIGLLEKPLGANRSGTLYTISYVLDSTGSQLLGTRLTSTELGTQRKYAIGGTDDAVLVPKQSRLYVSDLKHLRAIDTHTGRELWRTVISDRMSYVLGLGPSVMAISPDGRWLYLFSKSYAVSSPDVRYWLQIVDTTQGKILSNTIPLPQCDAIILFSTPSSGEYIYITCRQLLVLNTYTQRIEQTIPVTGTGVVLSPDGRWLYVVNSKLYISVVDLNQGRVVQQIARYQTQEDSVLDDSIALSYDGSKLVVVQAKSASDPSQLIFRIFNTTTWDEIRQFSYDRPIRTYALTFDANADSLFALTSSDQAIANATDTVVEFDANDGRVRAAQTRSQENILRVFTGPEDAHNAAENTSLFSGFLNIDRGHVE